MRTPKQARRNLILKLVSRFNKILPEALEPFSNSEKTHVLDLLQEAAKHLELKAEFQGVYIDFIDPILSTYKNKSKKFFSVGLHDYLVQTSLKLVDLIHDLKWDETTEQFMNDAEYKTYMQHIRSTLLKYRQQVYLNNDEEIISNKNQTNQIGKINDDLIFSKNDLIQSEIFTEELPEKPKNNNQFGDHLTIEQLAQFLNCSKATVHNYKAKGLPYYRIGRKVLFKKEEVLGFMVNENKNRKRT